MNEQKGPRKRGARGFPCSSEGTYQVGLVVGGKQAAHKGAAISGDDCHLLWMAQVRLVFKLER